jgi:hypothetical protein
MLTIATGDQKNMINSYVMNRIVANTTGYWMAQIDSGKASRHLIHLLNSLRSSAFVTNLIESYPDIAILLYMWDWRTSSNLDPKSTLYLEYFLNSDQYQRITSITLLHLAVSNLDKAIQVLFGWTGMLNPVLLRMRPAEGFYDNTCSHELWSYRIYNMLNECTKLSLDKRNHGPSIPIGQNERLLRDIIQRTADLPLDYTSNNEFINGAQFRMVSPPPLTFKPGEKASGEKKTPSAQPATTTRTPTDTSRHKDTSTASPITRAPKDFTAYKTLGVTIPAQPSVVPKHALCIMDCMAKYKIAFDNGTVPPRCVKKHSLKSGARFGTRIHHNEILEAFPTRYSLASAQHQTCNWLNDKPEIAVKIMTAMELDTVHFK